MPTDDLISVIIPAYNHERYIEECIRSIMAQTYRNIELLVIDDGSTDGTFEKIRALMPECEKRFVRIVAETQENQGTRKTLNRLVDIAKGQYVYTIASDDVSKPGAIELLHAFLSAHPDHVLVVGDNEIINGDSQRIYWGKDRKVVPESEALYRTFGDYLHLNEPDNRHPAFGGYDDLLGGNYIPNGALVSRQAMMDAGKYADGVFLEDWYMNLQLSKQGKFKYFPEILFSYRWHGANTVTNPEYIARTLNIFKQIYEAEKNYCFENGHKKRWKKQWSKRFGWRASLIKLRDFIRGKK